MKDIFKSLITGTSSKVDSEYSLRKSISEDIVGLLGDKKHQDFAELSLAISNEHGNTSISSVEEGQRILRENIMGLEQFVQLAKSIQITESPELIPDLIANAFMTGVGLEVGSELSCLLNPSKNWITNKYSIFFLFLLKHTGEFEKANPEFLTFLEKYQEKKFQKAAWTKTHESVGKALLFMLQILNSQITDSEAKEYDYLYADSVAKQIYYYFHPDEQKELKN